MTKSDRELHLAPLTSSHLKPSFESRVASPACDRISCAAAHDDDAHFSTKRPDRYGRAKALRVNALSYTMCVRSILGLERRAAGAVRPSMRPQARTHPKGLTARPASKAASAPALGNEVKCLEVETQGEGGQRCQPAADSASRCS